MLGRILERALLVTKPLRRIGVQDVEPRTVQKSAMPNIQKPASRAFIGKKIYSVQMARLICPFGAASDF